MRAALLQVVYTHNEPETERCVAAACDELKLLRMPALQGQSSLGEVRSEAARLALETECDGFIFVDSDMQFTVEDVARVLALLGKHDVVGCNYWDRSGVAPVWRPTAQAVADAGGKFTNGEGGSVVPARVGMGLTGFTRHAIELAARTAPVGENGTPHYFAQGVFDGEWLREDMAFSQRVMDAGGSCVVDTSVCPGHGGGCNPVYWWTGLVNRARPVGGTLFVRVEPVTELQAEPVVRGELPLTADDRARMARTDAADVAKVASIAADRGRIP